MKYCRYMLIVLAGVILMSCSKKEENKITIKFEEAAKIGYETGTGDEMIGMAADFIVDKNENIYVADYLAGKVKVYSPAGKLIKLFGKGKGEGPGEFKEIRSIDLDNNGNLYVSDMSRGIVAIFDSTGALIKEFKSKLRPAYLIANSINEVYFLGFWNHKTDKVLSKLDLSKENPEMTAFKFCDRFTGANSWEIANVGYTGSIFKDKEENIYYSANYPYYIRKFSKEGKLISEFTRDIYFYEPPYLKQKDPQYVAPLSGSQTAVLLGNKYILNQIFRLDKDSNKFVTYLDVLDKNSGEFLGLFTEKELNMDFSRYMYADEKGYFYNFCNEPYPHVKKYKVLIEPVKKG